MHPVREREPRRENEMDMKFQVHCIEKQAYSSVLRAFIAQSELLSWGKEGLLTDLCRELCITDAEHAELLVKINSDESVQMIRNWRKPVSGIAAPTSVACVSQKKKKVAHSSATKAQNQAQFQANHLQDDRDMLLAGNSMNSFSHNIPKSSKSKGSESHVKKDYRAPYVGGNFKKTSNFIKIRATDNVIQEVKSMIYGSNNTDPVQIEKAKSILSEHENSILVALGKLSDVLGEASPNKMREFCSREWFPANGEETPAQTGFYVPSGRFNFHGNVSDGKI